MPHDAAERHTDVGSPIIAYSDDDFLQLSEALELQQQLLKATHKLSGTGVLQMDLQTGALTGLNDACEILRLSRDDSAESFEALIALVHPEHRHAFRTTIGSCSQRSATFSFTTEFCGADGLARPVECRGTVLPGKHNHPAWLALTLHIVEDRQQHDDVGQCAVDSPHRQTAHNRESVGPAPDVTHVGMDVRQWQHVQKMEPVGQLAGGIAHDFNNLLTVINSHCQILLSQMSGEDPHARSVSSILEAGERAARLNRHLLAVSRRSVAGPEIVNVNDVLQESRSLFQRLVAEHATFDTDLAAELPCIRVNRSQLDQAIMNIVLNASDACMNDGEILVRTTVVTLSAEQLPRPELPDGNYVCIAISDSGTGMSSDICTQIFEPFFSTKGSQGTGLGLTVANDFILRNEGFVSVESEEGNGTTISVFCPVTDEKMSTAASSSVPNGAGGAETILLVEDEAAVRNLLQKILEADGYTVVAAEDAEEALQCFERHQDAIDLLVTDVVMPAMNGQELASRLRSQNPNLSILYMSGYTSDTIAEFAPETFQAGFLQKPFPPSELVAQVRRQIASAVGG